MALGIRFRAKKALQHNRIHLVNLALLILAATPYASLPYANKPVKRELASKWAIPRISLVDVAFDYLVKSRSIQTLKLMKIDVAPFGKTIRIYTDFQTSDRLARRSMVEIEGIQAMASNAVGAFLSGHFGIILM